MTDKTKLDRRSFLRRAAIGAPAAVAGGLAAPAVLAQAPIVLKMQTSWPSGDVWQEFAQDYANRVEEMAGGRLKIDVLPAGAIVGAFQVLDAVNDGVLDAAHSVPVYWYGKNKAASLFGTGPVFGGSATTCRWHSFRAAKSSPRWSVA
jgi:TRAP-type mannitol/chloroaromatic compound transport system substrate-binding protein